MVKRSTGSRVVGLLLILVSAAAAAVAWGFPASFIQRISTTLLACALIILGYQMSLSERALPIGLVIVAVLCATVALVLGAWSAASGLR
jgi:hypothetical protein